MLTLDQCIENRLNQLKQYSSSLRTDTVAKKGQYQSARKYCKNFLPLYENDKVLSDNIDSLDQDHNSLVNAHNNLAYAHTTLSGAVESQASEMKGE